jgi:CheY-like chemotaxis protein
MVIRVLLADESTTIKKVMQLALQDFDVEVKAVLTGLDVLEVARIFKPDIIFADILLQKKNGYEVSAEIKSDPLLSRVPVVLMWSSFMDLDENLARRARAEGRLEKPFEIESLRQLIYELLPQTKGHRLAPHLEFPDSFARPLRDEVANNSLDKRMAAPNVAPIATPNVAATPTATHFAPTAAAVPIASTENTYKAPSSSWTMDNFDDIVDFAAATEHATTEHEEPWSHQDLSRFKLDLSPVEVEGEDFALAVDLAEPVDEMSGFVFQSTTPTTAERKVDSREYRVDRFESDLGQESKLELDLQLEAGDLTDSESDSDPDHLSESKFSSGADFRSGTDFGSGSSFHTSSTFSSGFGEKIAVPQLSADRLEEIVRAQSREIIEALVKKIVPDLATDLIRKELQRLLDDNGQGKTDRKSEREIRP